MKGKKTSPASERPPEPEAQDDVTRIVDAPFEDAPQAPAERRRRPARYQEYPKWRYHPSHDPVVVTDPDDEAARTPTDDGWLASPGRS